ncbi:hypothetical protein A3715_10990 [Oleiphilus sp. HI0009]|nr:sterol desaturase family protein [Oleiphilus sp. HI0067]KZX78049.1 hypothetical protein A3715_10990 [Oleiphilus sp. HI0009]KZY66143.1 hypothetical protein A3738_07220 [Oleiphilus sp. HI0066]KZY72712.1 hypothetical protein A3739_03210 [Oleiphilus sp. HI0067]KZY73542.1 hypothetical protein A3739_26325 [Oleiphilus sp. HI0067]
MEVLSSVIEQYQSIIRLSVFGLCLMSLSLIEHLIPARQSGKNNPRHFVENISLTGLTSLALQIVPVVLAANIALLNESWQIGIFYLISDNNNQLAIIVIVSVIILDFIIYWQHRVFHRVPILWKLHRVHHSDPSLNASSALRFHPFELLLSTLIKSTVVLVFGIPFAAIVIFEIALNAFALFNHSNIRFTPRTENVLRKILITPSIHRVHHSIHHADHDQNFGFSVVFWDRLFGTYKSESSLGRHYSIGSNEMTNENCKGFYRLLKQPFIPTKSLQKTQ